MNSIDILLARLDGLSRNDLEHWIAQNWVRPDHVAGEPVFREIDIARVQLILELRTEMDIDEAALPVILSLLDQVYDLRRRMRELAAALEQAAPEPVRQNLLALLARAAD